jgi:hypothetical protein
MYASSEGVGLYDVKYASNVIQHPLGPAAYVKALPHWSQWAVPRVRVGWPGGSSVFGLEVAYSEQALTAKIDRGFVVVDEAANLTDIAGSIRYTHAMCLASAPGWDALARIAALRPLLVGDILTALPWLAAEVNVLASTGAWYPYTPVGADPGSADLVGLRPSLTVSAVTGMAQATVADRADLISSTIMSTGSAVGALGTIFLVLDENHWFPALFYVRNRSTSEIAADDKATRPYDQFPRYRSYMLNRPIGYGGQNNPEWPPLTV